MKTQYRNLATRLLLTTAIGTLAACGGDDDNNNTVVTPPAPPVTQQFEISVVNLTAAQPFSPIAVIAHGGEYSAFTVGEAATPGLERLAEAGDNAEFIDEAEADAAVVATVSGDGPLGPGATEILSIEVEEDQLAGLQVTGITMLVNTNDAITAARGLSLEGMEVGDSIQVSIISYDSGTESNTEAAGTIPGPADEGEGFNAARDDIADEVRAHPGVLTADDGLAASVLTEVHRWDNPVARVSVTRVQ